MGFLAAIGDAIAEHLKPLILEKADQLLESVAERIQAEVEKRIPVIIEAVVVAVTKTMGDLAVNGADRITDLVPGELDDQIIDPLVSNIVEQIRHRFGIHF